MITRLLVLIYLATIGKVFVSAKFSNHQAQIIVCSNGTRLEPSLKEIFESLIPHDLPENELAKVRAVYESYFNVNKHTGKNIISQRIMEYAFQLMESVSSLTVPLRSMISDGTYTVDMTTDWFYFRDVLLVQQNFLFINTLCSLIPHQLVTVRAILCKCFIGEPLSPRDAIIASSRFAGFHAGNAHQWCVRNPCTDRSTRDGSCQVSVDPFRTSCVLIAQSAVPSTVTTNTNGAPVAVKVDGEVDETPINEELAQSKESEIRPFSVNLITYNLTTPVMEKTAYGLERMFVELTTTGKANNRAGKRSKYSSLTEEYYEIVIAKVEHVLNMIASLTPMYLFNLIMGCSLMILNDDLASSPFVQYIIAACFGTILAFIWLAMALYRMVENMTKSTMPPFHPLLAPVSFLSTSYLFTGPMVRDRMLDMMMQFWRSGAFDLPWLGKAYFLTSIVVSLGLTHWLGLFTPKSSTFLALRMAISLTGVLFLTASTPSIEICVVFLLMCLKRDDINHYIWQAYMHVAASPPTEYYTGKRLTKQEFELEGRLETQRALQKLQEFLAKNPEEMDVVCNHPMNLEKGTSTLMDRFARGHYSGIPLAEADDAPDRGATWWWFLLKLGMKTALVGSIAMVVAFLVSKRYA